MNKKENIPKIRFIGFTDLWEQRKLNQFLETSKVINNNNYSRNDVLSVSGTFGIVNQIEFQGRSFAGKSLVKYHVVKQGEVVYTKSPLKTNPYGIIKANLNKAGIVSTLYAVYKTLNGTNPVFVQFYFEPNFRINKYLKPLVNIGAKNDMKITDDNVLVGKVIFPQIREQNKITNLLVIIDNLITLHQREYKI